MPDYAMEQRIKDRLGPHALVAGVDEVGRGPWAGPVVACAVVLDPVILPVWVAEQIQDSKTLTAKKRDMLYPWLVDHSYYNLGQCDVAEIDHNGILQATLLAMKRAVDGLEVRPDYVLVDGNRMPDAAMGWDYAGEPVIKGDSISLSVASASIIAKVTRDKMMAELAQQYPHYGWESNAGYGTKAHQQGLASHGVTPYHRRSFAPVAKIIRGA